MLFLERFRYVVSGIEIGKVEKRIWHKTYVAAQNSSSSFISGVWLGKTKNNNKNESMNTAYFANIFLRFFSIPIAILETTFNINVARNRGRHIKYPPAGMMNYSL
jgi:hypothetical protein